MNPRLKIGWAVRDITPRCPVALRGQFNLRIATTIADPLSLTALALGGGDEQVIVVSVDAGAVDQTVIEQGREILRDRLPGFDPRKLIVCATHTHTAPFAGKGTWLQTDEDYMKDILAKYPGYMTTAQYTDLLVDALVSAACEAWEKRREGHVGWGYSYAVVGENRRVRVFDGHTVMYGKVSEADFSHIEGHVDHGVNLLFTCDAAQKLTGVVVNLACPSQASAGGQTMVSADFWHETREELRRRYGAGLFILPQCSAAGDQTPVRIIAVRAEQRMLRLKYGEAQTKTPNTALRRDIARRIADAVADAEPAVRKELHDAVVLKHQYRALELPHWNVTDKEYAALQDEIAKLRQQLEKVGEGDRLSSTYTSLQSRIRWCQRAVDRYRSPLKSIPIQMNILRLGDIAFVTAPFEYYLDFGDRIKGRCNPLQTFVVQLAGGGTYLPTERAASGGGYGAIPASCRVSPQGGQVIVNEAVAAVNAMFAAE
jgi:hypothetical protein